MDAVNQITVKVSESYVSEESVDIIYLESTDIAFEVAIGTPEENDMVLVQDLGNAGTNNVTLTSDKLINGSTTYTVDIDSVLIRLEYDSTAETWTATEMTGYIIATMDITLDASHKTVYVDTSAIGIPFTITLNPSPETNDEVDILDYTGNCGTIAATVDGNGKLIIGYDDAIMNQNFIRYTLKYNGTQHNM